MKKSMLIIAGGLVFAALFYENELGLNTLLYSLFLIIALVLNNRALLKKSATIISALGMLASATAVTYHGTNLSIWLYFISTITFIGYVASSSSSIYVSWFNGIYTILMGTFHAFLYQITPDTTQPVHKIDAWQLTKLIVIPLVFIVLFSSLYSQINPVFMDWINHIDLHFLNALWMLTAAIGAFIMSNVAQPRPVRGVTIKDANTANLLAPRIINDTEIPVIKREIQVGTYLLIALNLLLIIVLASEFMFITNLQDFKASALSQAVHHGVYASIFSILVAIAIIAFYYRGAVNFMPNYKILTHLTYGWIGLNSLLIVSIFIKNYLYIQQYGLTYKRLGVMVYLSLCIVGLSTTIFKIHFKANFTYLMRRNTVASYVIIAVFALWNWPAIITTYNIDHEFKSKSHFKRLLPQNAVVLKRNGLLEETIAPNNKYHKRSTQTTYPQPRNWQEFNYVNYELSK